MKKIYLVSSLVVGFLIQYGNGQTGYLSDGKLANNSNKPDCVALADKDGKVVPERSCGVENQKSKVPVKSRIGSQLDPVTEQMVEAAVVQMEKQAETSLQEATGKFMSDYSAQDHGVMTSIDARKRIASNDILKMLAPSLVADRESFTRDILTELLRYNLNPGSLHGQIAE